MKTLTIEQIADAIRPCLQRERPPRSWPIRNGHRAMAVTSTGLIEDPAAVEEADREAQGLYFCSEHAFIESVNHRDGFYHMPERHKKGSFVHIPRGNVPTVDQLHVVCEDGKDLVTSPR